MISITFKLFSNDDGEERNKIFSEFKNLKLNRYKIQQTENNMYEKWQCQFNKAPKQITVGQKLIMLCEGEKAVSFKKPVHIEFLDKQQIYSLHVLKTLKRENHFLALEVVSYRTEKFESPFIITDGEKKLVIEDFSFSVQSVLSETKQLVQPHGPFGPFKPPLHLSYLSIMTLTFFSLITCVFIFLYRFFKRRNFVQKVLNRKTYLSPSKSFILHLRKYKGDTHNSIKNLENLFKIFLEDLFFIPVIDKKNEKIMKSLKRNNQQIYKKQGQKISQILNELSLLKQNAGDKKIFLKLKQVCQDTVFLLESEKEKN